MLYCAFFAQVVLSDGLVESIDTVRALALDVLVFGDILMGMYAERCTC